MRPITRSLSAGIVATIVITSLISGWLLGYSIYGQSNSENMADLQKQVLTLQTQIADIQSSQGEVAQSNTYLLSDNVLFPTSTRK